MTRRTLLAQGSLLVDLTPESLPAFLDLPADERAAANDHFRYALMGGNEEEQEELFEQLHQSEFRVPVAVDDEAQPEPEHVRAVAERVIAAYNARTADFDLAFEPLGPDARPSSVRYVYDEPAGRWNAVHEWPLTVATGNASGSDFNWLPLAAARAQGDHRLPADLDFLVSGKRVRVDLVYRVSVTLPAE